MRIGKKRKSVGLVNSLLLFFLLFLLLTINTFSGSSSVPVTVLVINKPTVPKTFWLGQNYPNPFNPETVIEYGIPENCRVVLTIYNIRGQKAITLINQYQDAGYKKVRWNSKDNNGKELSSGIYFYELKAGRYRDVKKMIILK